MHLCDRMLLSGQIQIKKLDDSDLEMSHFDKVKCTSVDAEHE